MNDIFQVIYAGIPAVATRLESSPLGCDWVVNFGDSFIKFYEDYRGTYRLLECSADIDVEGCQKEMSSICGQIRKFIIDNAPKPPKRYRSR